MEDLKNKDSKKIEYKSKLALAWKDPVWSKVISVGILSIVTLIYSLAKSLITEGKGGVLQVLESAINYRISVYHFLMIAAILSLLNLGWIRYKLFAGVRIESKPSFNTEQLIGDFTFRELFNALLTRSVNVPHLEKEYDLLTLFKSSERHLNVGLNIDEPGELSAFIFFNLAPILVSYGLVDVVYQESDTSNGKKLQTFVTSKTGLQFRVTLAKWQLYKELEETSSDEVLVDVKTNP